MPKRKREDPDDLIDKIEDRAVRIKASRLKAKINHGNKSLKDALNLARGFERQKLGRRQKQASSEPRTLLRLREEVIVLKELEVEKVAWNYLLKQLVKTKRIKETAAFTALYGEDPKTEPPKSNAEANVLGRLFKANPVKEVLPGVMDGIKQVLNLDDSRPPTQSVHGESFRDKREATQLAEGQEDALDDDVFDGFSDGVGSASLGSDDSDGGSDEIDFDMFNDRLAGSSEESENENENSEEALDPMEISDIEDHDHEPDISDSGSQSQSDSSPHKGPQHNGPRQAPVQKLSSTAFLPSLSMGGYYSGSESGDEDNIDDIDDGRRGPAQPKPRKNRRGQRERQKIAELKHGKEAKHLQKPRQSAKDDRQKGWDARRGAVGGNGYDPKQRRFGTGSRARSDGPTGANGEAVVAGRPRTSTGRNAKKIEGPLHPSWEAAKRKKEESGKVAFTGKKITFN